MKTIVLILAVAVVSLTSCTKTTYISNPLDPTSSPSSSTYYVKATINGTNLEYHYTGALNENPGTINIYGYSTIASNSDGIYILIQLLRDNDYSNVGIGVYTDTANVNDPRGYTDSAGSYNPYFNPNQAFLTVQLSGEDYGSNEAIDADSSTPFTCTITAIDSVSISGTFSGKGYFGNSAKTITNGSFYVPF